VQMHSNKSDLYSEISENSLLMEMV
jgi:hypothetical protein